VPLPKFLLSYLARQCGGRSRDDLLFPGDDGRHLRRPHPVSGWFAKARAESGVPRTTPTICATVRPASRCRLGRTSTRSKDARHALAAMTLDIYADLFDDDTGGRRRGST